MSLKFCSLASGSTGNGYLVSSPNALVLIDAGATQKNLKAGLDSLGKSFEDIDAILITHEHWDHISGLFSVKKKAVNAGIIASRSTINAIEERTDGYLSDSYSLETLSAALLSESAKPTRLTTSTASPQSSHGGRFRIGDIDILAFNLSHDADGPTGFTLSSGLDSISIATDTGVFSDEIFYAIKESNLIVIEANHEENVLMMGNYPYELKRRILGEYGHLSNEACANGIIRILRERESEIIPQIALAHLSKENNSPDLARATVRGLLENSSFLEGKEYSLAVLPARELWMNY